VGQPCKVLITSNLYSGDSLIIAFEQNVNFQNHAILDNALRFRLNLCDHFVG